MKKSFTWLTMLLALTVVGCADSDTTAPGTEGEPGSIQQEGDVGGTSTEDNITPAGDANTEEDAASGASIGNPAPAWENLTGTDDQQHSLADLNEAEAVAVVFTCNLCPVAIDYEDRLIELANQYKDRGVEVVAINVNRAEAEALPAMKQRAEEKGFTFAYLKDPSQEVGRAYGATVTPHVFLLDKDHTVVYMGAIDDNQNISQVEHHHLRDAIDAVLAGNAPEVDTTNQFGCAIHYE